MPPDRTIWYDWLGVSTDNLMSSRSPRMSDFRVVTFWAYKEHTWRTLMFDQLRHGLKNLY